MHKSKHGQEDTELMITDDMASLDTKEISKRSVTGGTKEIYRSSSQADGKEIYRSSSLSGPRDVPRMPGTTTSKNLERTPVGPVEMTPSIDGTIAGNVEDVDVAYNKYANVRDVEPVWYVQMKTVIPILVVLAIVVLLAWWWYDTYLLRKKKVTPTVDFSAMLQTFYSYSDDFWFSKDISVFKENLADSKYHFIIADSNLQVIYDNRNSYNWLYPNYEIIKTIQDDKPTLVSLNGVRTLAATVHKGSSVRIVHMEYTG